jgi:hypothetical protein
MPPAPPAVTPDSTKGTPTYRFSSFTTGNPRPNSLLILDLFYSSI